MNFLAHLYLSGEEEPVLLGNFMADFVKGHPENRLRMILSEAVIASDTFPGILMGVQLHRHIDYFTDTHPIVELTKARLRPEFRKYAGVISDMFYDHFLAANWDAYSGEPLENFAQRIYTTLQRNRAVFPAEMDRLLHYMTTQNWLVSYAQPEGIARALRGIAHRTTQRTSVESGMERAGDELLKNYDAYQQEFTQFFPRLVLSARTFLEG